MKKKSRIQYLVILDESGSMESIKDFVITSFNEQVDFISKLNGEKKVQVSLTTFNDEVNIHGQKLDVNKLEKLSSRNYQPSSCTALYDAIGMSVNQLKEKMKKKDELFLVVFTDGMENASKFYNSHQICGMMDQLKEEGHTIKFICTENEKHIYKDTLQLDDDLMMCVDECPDFGEIKQTFESLNHSLREKINN